MKNKYWLRITRSARGEWFNPLLWPFLFATFSYGVGFTFFGFTEAVGQSSVFVAMTALGPAFPVIWGVIAILTIIGGLTFLLFNIPPFGKISGLIGFMLWFMVGICYVFSGGYLTLFSVAAPNMFFWFWQYLSLSLFRREDAQDKAMMERYDDEGTSTILGDGPGEVNETGV